MNTVDPCPGCPEGSVCKKPTCGRLKPATTPDARLRESVGVLARAVKTAIMTGAGDLHRFYQKELSDVVELWERDANPMIGGRQGDTITAITHGTGRSVVAYAVYAEVEGELVMQWPPSPTFASAELHRKMYEKYVKTVVLPLTSTVGEDSIAVLTAENVKLEALCDSTYVAQGADAYNHACEVLESFQEKRARDGKEPGCQGSLCGGMEWLYARVGKLECLVNASTFTQNSVLVNQIREALETGASELGERNDRDLVRPTALQELLDAHTALGKSLDAPVFIEPLSPLRTEAIACYKAPFKYESGYIFDANMQMFSDNHGTVKNDSIQQVRGWGRLGKMKDGAKIQDEIGAVIAEALTSYWDAKAAK